MRKSLEERFWSKVSIDFENVENCLEWTGKSRKRGGYGRFFLIREDLGKKNVSSNRMVWELVFGEIPDGMMVCHKCDNPPCCNPSHLFLGTAYENYHDAVKKGRISLSPAHLVGLIKRVGMDVGSAKLTDEQVLDIREKHIQGLSNGLISRQFSVSQGTVSRIINRKLWNHL